MNLIYHHRTRGTGVEAVHILGIVRAFERRGWSVRVLSPPGVDLEGREPGGATATSRPSRRLWQAISEHTPQLAFECLELGYNLHARRRLSRALQATPVDLIYDRYALFDWAPVSVARRHRVPIVLEVNDATVITRTRPLVARRVAERIERWSFQHATRLVTITERFKALVVERHRIAPDRVVVLPNAVDPDRFALDEGHPVPGSHRPFIIGMVGAYVPWHGVGFLLDTIHPFLTRTGARLVLVGDGPERAVIEERVRRYGLTQGVELTGFVPPCEVPRCLQRMDVCVLPHSNEHGSPMKIFEYMASGKPVLAPALPGVRDIITHQVDGWLFQPLDGASLAAGLDALHRNPELRARLGQAARATVLDKHTWDHRAEALLRALEIAPPAPA